MKLKKFFKNFDLKESRTVEIYDNDDLIYAGQVNEIPEEILNMKLQKWCNMLSTQVRDVDIIDEDNESIVINMYLFVRVKWLNLWCFVDV